MRACTAIAALVLAACVVDPTPKPPPPAPRVVAPPPPRTYSPADIAARAMPAVVTIRTEQSLGTGFIVRPDGWVATNLHVIADGSRVRVTLRDSRVLDVVEILAASTAYDLALVRIEAHNLPVLALGDSNAMRAGDPVVAIGNPLGLEDTVSNGLVSARRKFEDGFEALQVSAPIAPGSSGGPLFNDRGEVIGVATAVMREGQNLNFGVPIRYLLPLIAKPERMPVAEFAAIMETLRQANVPRPRPSAPHLPLSALDGCSVSAQKLIVRMVGAAIETGAPLYNAGKPDACYHVYDGATSDLLRKLSPACKGPAKTLTDAQKRAASLPNAGAQAWVMRDAFDGVLDVIARKQEQ